MCLICDSCAAKMAEKDIECYKVVYEYGYGVTNKPGKYTSELTDFVYEEGERYHDDNFMMSLGNKGIVGKGFHSYEFLEDAIKNSSMIMDVVRCVIPKGSMYYHGKYGYMDCCGYCSDGLVVKGVIKKG